MLPTTLYQMELWVGLPVLLLMSILMSSSGKLIGLCQYRYGLDSYTDIIEVSYNSQI